MPTYFQHRVMRRLLIGLSVSLVLLVVAFAFFNWWITFVGLLVIAPLLWFSFSYEKRFFEDTEQYISTLSYRIKRVGEEALMEMPVGILLFNDDFYVEWANPYLSSFIEDGPMIGRSLYDVADVLLPVIKREGNTEETVSWSGRIFRVVHKQDEKLLYFFDVTEQSQVEEQFEADRTVLAVIFLDNYDELTQGMDDSARSNINNSVTTLLNAWANEHHIYVKRISSDRFIAVMNENILRELEQEKFTILDSIREMTSKQNVPLTLSIGIGSGAESLPELGLQAQSSLDLALGRGGDQVAIKQQNGKVKFFGGKTNPMEKRTRVRARVISHALRELILGSDQVIVMGHKRPDMDAIGASIGIRKIAQMNDREGYVAVDFSQIDSGVKRLMDEIKGKPDLFSHMITPEEALEMATEDTLLVIVDTHKPSLVIEERLLNKVEKVVVIDHHRRGEEFIQNPLLVYMEPYASSTAELVTELLDYQPKHEKITMLEATALLAGIIVDTKSFTLRTGSRTFDAASYLRTLGADTVLVQQFLREDVTTYVERAKLVETVEFFKHGMAIATGEEDRVHDSVIIAQAADTLLSMEDVAASFVVAMREENVVGISARSLGTVNVQLIMERLEGGGHLTNAATQLYDITIDEAVERLKTAINEHIEGSSEE
ncbi:DHH family phosphoesterase [Jeotgalibacillus sp. ET6]|uniref:DHH family phosphoesterase n=1 Tax=Jeotgalibacillus sp. ET6 TaxID=3037260 RepID=UPI0024183BEF|nr:DHH family phosphoesterase [Jeotgalibacillus sp. ET6]MDG5473890.1 DHH family phosphoesterase [Jeotgalibacillus sp. ET6]